MFLVDRLILIAGILLLVGIASSKLSSRVGLPVLVLFLLVGMLAGSEGIGGIGFENYQLAHGIGTLALAVILFDGGLRTPVDAFRVAWKPSLALATGGVLITALATGAAAALILGIPFLQGVLLGSIIGSTDAAAVFSILRSQGLRLRERLAATLEIESGSNDPMAVFLTVGLIEVLLGRMTLGVGLLGFFVLQMGVGALAGLGVGRAAVHLINRINLGSAGLYPVLTAVCGLLAYGLAASLGGSGFLSVYVAGIVIGNSRIVFQRGTLLFHDGLAWVGQIVMFVVLGLLSFPSQLLAVAWQGLAVAGVLILLARPLAVTVMLLPFRFPPREVLFLSWVGLKGAVPIILATYPLLLGLPGGALLFNVVFFVVLVSAVTQGWSLPAVARRLGLQEEGAPEPPVTLEITSLRDVDADIVEYTVAGGSRAAGRRISELALPDGVVVSMIVREETIIPPRGSTRVLPGDHLFLVLRPGARALTDQVFSREPLTVVPVTSVVEFPLRGSTTAAELEEFYGIHLDVEGTRTLDEVMRDRLGRELEEGQCIEVGGVRLHAREILDGRVERVGLAIGALEES